MDNQKMNETVEAFYSGGLLYTIKRNGDIHVSSPKTKNNINNIKESNCKIKRGIKMGKIHVVWCSRHEMTDAQKEDLAEMLKVSEERNMSIYITRLNMIWEVSSDVEHDLKINRSKWKALTGYDVVAGVFPPVALECRPYESLYCAVSKQEKTLREDGSSKIEFVHVRWTGI